MIQPLSGSHAKEEKLLQSKSEGGKHFSAFSAESKCSQKAMPICSRRSPLGGSSPKGLAYFSKVDQNTRSYISSKWENSQERTKLKRSKEVSFKVGVNWHSTPLS